MIISITLDEQLLHNLDIEASNLYISRSAYISMACSEAVQRDFIRRMSELQKLIDKNNK